MLHSRGPMTRTTCSQVSAFVAAVMLGSACTSASAVRTGAAHYDARPASSPVDTYFKGQQPGRPYEELGVVKAQYKSGTGFSYPTVEELLPKLHEATRGLGGDAVI